jgi:hypothetical protein
VFLTIFSRRSGPEANSKATGGARWRRTQPLSDNNIGPQFRNVRFGIGLREIG